MPKKRTITEEDIREQMRAAYAQNGFAQGLHPSSMNAKLSLSRSVADLENRVHVAESVARRLHQENEQLRLWAYEAQARLQETAAGPAWCKVLHVTAGAPRAVIEAAYRVLAKSAHPDAGGSAAEMTALNNARDEALKQCS